MGASEKSMRDAQRIQDRLRNLRVGGDEEREMIAAALDTARAESPDIPRHVRIAMANAQRAFESDDVRALATINEDIQGLVDAAIGYARRREATARAEGRAEGRREMREEAANVLLERLRMVRRLMEQMTDEDGDVSNPEAMRAAERREDLYARVLDAIRAIPDTPPATGGKE